MSFSKPKLVNPCKKFIEFKGDKGIFQYWDKEMEQNVELSTPCFLIVLDELSTIKGYSDEHNCGIYSNEVHSLNNEILKVKTFKGGFSVTGKYSSIKNAIKSAGGKFTKSVYCMMFDKENNSELVNFQLSGAAFSAWLDFKYDAQLHVVSITGECTNESKGAIKYKKPIFHRYAMKHELIETAKEYDITLQEYFKQYKQDVQESEIELSGKIIEEMEVSDYTNSVEVKQEFKADEYDAPPPEEDDLPF